jgi:carboxypeptidase Taq
MTSHKTPVEYNTLVEQLREIRDIETACAVLHWDQATYMPPLGAEARGRQLATLSRLAHEKFISPEIGRLLDSLENFKNELDSDSLEACLLRETRRQYEKALKVPPELEAEIIQHEAASYNVWQKARPENNFNAVKPCLEKTLELSLKLADCFPGYDHPADPLIDFSDRGMKAESIRDLFSQLRGELVPLVDAVTTCPPSNDSCLRQDFLEADQMAFARKVVEQFGYDFQRGRLDLTAHPFEISFSLGDVRITTRARPDFFGDCFFSVLHEAGHALYEQGSAPELDGLPIVGGVSSGIHESQSRLWENLVGRSRAFWTYWLPIAKQVFPTQFGAVELDEFYHAINMVKRSLIRTDADELTYNLHVMMRFDFELAMLEGSLEVSDLPEAWRERMHSDLGIIPEDDKDGCLQDVHWFAGRIGGVFQGYTIGNILSAQFYSAAVKADSSIPDEIEQGNYKKLHTWLQKNIYRHGSKYPPDEIILRATGSLLTIEPYMNYLEEKYGELYNL